MSAQARLSRKWITLTGLGLAALPVMAVCTQSARIAYGQSMLLPAQVTQLRHDTLVPSVALQTSLSTLSLTKLSGDNYFEAGQTAYVFLKLSNNAGYPYAVLNRPVASAASHNDTLMLRAKVIAQSGDQLQLAYGFDQVSPSSHFTQALANSDKPVRVSLAVSKDGRTSVSALHLGDAQYDQRVILKSVLLGFNMISAKTAPPT